MWYNLRAFKEVVSSWKHQREYSFNILFYSWLSLERTALRSAVILTGRQVLFNKAILRSVHVPEWLLHKNGTLNSHSTHTEKYGVFPLSWRPLSVWTGNTREAAPRTVFLLSLFFFCLKVWKRATLGLLQVKLLFLYPWKTLPNKRR